MELIGKNRAVLLVLSALVLALIAASRLASDPRGPVCVELAAAQPGFAALTTSANPACIRIRLR